MCDAYPLDGVEQWAEHVAMWDAGAEDGGEAGFRKVQTPNVEV